MPSKQHLAVIGTGVGAMSAVYVLTSLPDWRERFEITVYQLGWRMGGKGASGRNPAIANRIEEHGLHVWSGFYQNAFRLIKDVYANAGRSPDAPLATWQKAFTGQNFVTWEDQVGDTWVPWSVNVPTDDTVDPGNGGHLPTPWEFILEMVPWALKFLTSSGHESVQHAVAHQEPEDLGDWLRDVVHQAAHEAQIVVEAASGGLVQGLGILSLAHSLITAHDGPPEHESVRYHAITGLLAKFQEWLHAHFAPQVLAEELRHILVILDLAITYVRGMIADGVVWHGFDVIDGMDFRAWCRKHGAADIAVDSALVRGVYDYIFAYEQGDTQRPSLAAGVALRMVFRLLMTNKGAFFYKMEAGMGDTIFAPLYQVLKDRGVRFRFFHRIEALELDAKGESVETLRVAEQVRMKHGEYEPLFDVNGLPCWPSEPFYDQIVEGEELRRLGINLESAWSPWQDARHFELKRGVDFDHVLLGASLGALPYLAPDLVSAEPRWKAMVERVGTVRTQAMQLWLSEDAAALGWESDPTILTSYAEPFDTWADLTHLLPRESWPASAEPRNLAYFCGPLQEDECPPFSDHGFPARETERAKERARRWLDANAAGLWPKATPPRNPKGLDFDLLVDLQRGDAEERFGAQYFRANMNPTDLYNLSLPGSTEFRLKAGDSGFTNLTLAGDWLRTGLNYGCVEGAVMGGFQAARALSGVPSFIYGETDFQEQDHFDPGFLPGVPAVEPV
ncbi:MAG TPA: NAD(P)-binding protein [Stenomitos sp.]